MAGFIGGLAEGLQGLPAEVGNIVGGRRADKAAAALAAWAAAQGQQQQQGAPPAPAPANANPNPMAALAAVGGGGAARAPAPPPPVAPGQPPAPGMPPAAAPPNPMAGKPPQPPGLPPPDPNLSATAQPDQKFSDPVQEAQQSLGAMIRSIKAANPKIDPRTLLAAVHMQLDDVKGLLPTTRAVMQGQVQLLRQQVDMQFKYTKLNDENERYAAKLAELAKRHADQHEFELARTAHMQATDRINSAREGDYSRSVDYQHEDRQDSIGARITVANINGKFRLQGIEEQQDGAGQRSQAALEGKHGAAIASGLSKFLSLNPNADAAALDAVTQSLETAYGTHSQGQAPAPKAPAPKPAPKGGGIPTNVQAFAKQHGLTVIRKRADGKYDAKDKNGTPGVIG